MRPMRSTPDTAALAVHPWPGALPAAHDGLIVIGIAASPGERREVARERVRLAVRQAAAQLSGLAADQIELASQPGQAPRLRLTSAGVTSNAGLSISHEDGLSLAAIHLHGPAGVDLMRIQDVPDWQAVARDYLGEAVADALAQLAPPQRMIAFARAWTRREAGLKCEGLPLGEWTALPCAARWRHRELALPAGPCGTLVIKETVQ
jgi:4'-phosphopantetheinyl transferase